MLNQTLTKKQMCTATLRRIFFFFFSFTCIGCHTFTGLQLYLHDSYNIFVWYYLSHWSANICKVWALRLRGLQCQEGILHYKSLHLFLSFCVLIIWLVKNLPVKVFNHGKQHVSSMIGLFQGRVNKWQFTSIMSLHRGCGI